MLWLILWLTPYAEPAKPIVDTVDHIEFNCLFDAKGRHVLNQIILWERGHVVHWQLAQPYDVPIPNGVRTFRSGVYREYRYRYGTLHTITDDDPEQMDLLKLPKHERRGLRPETR